MKGEGISRERVRLIRRQEGLQVVRKRNAKANVQSGSIRALALAAQQAAVNARTVVEGPAVVDLDLAGPASTVNSRIQAESATRDLSVLPWAGWANAKKNVGSAAEIGLALAPRRSDIKLIQSVHSTSPTVDLNTLTSTISADTQATSPLAALVIAVNPSRVGIGVRSNWTGMALAGFTSVVNAQANALSPVLTLTIAPFLASINAKNHVNSTVGALGVMTYSSTAHVWTDVYSNPVALSLGPWVSASSIHSRVASSPAELDLMVLTSGVNAGNEVISGVLTFSI